MKPIAFIINTALVAAAAGLAYVWYDSSKIIELVPGQKYLVIANGIGEDGTNWTDVSNELAKMNLTGYKLTRSGKKALLTYVLNAAAFSKLKIGEPIFQVEGVQFIARDVDKL